LTQFTFDEVVEYVRGLQGREVRVHVRAEGRGETGAFLAGTLAAVHTFPAGRPPTDLHRHFCQVGGERGIGFILSPHDFDSARIDLYDPESFAVFISFRETDFKVVIPDDRLERYDQPLPGVQN